MIKLTFVIDCLEATKSESLNPKDLNLFCKNTNMNNDNTQKCSKATFFRLDNNYKNEFWLMIVTWGFFLVLKSSHYKKK